ncbi:hypothetical protein FRB99_005106 [Tulasnella sp. 403]|nr:hypothetical protein FRB99_005106 [Tulasnella sp. 403]
MTTCLFVLAALISATTFILQPSSEAVSVGNTLEVDHISTGVKRLGYYRKQYPVASLTFNLTADLEPLFNWNTKQLFVYITAEYDQQKTDVHNQVVIWDGIIRKRKDAKLRLVKQRPKYPLREFSGKFQTALGANYTLHYDVMPYVGILTSGTGGKSRLARWFRT